MEVAEAWTDKVPFFGKPELRRVKLLDSIAFNGNMRLILELEAWGTERVAGEDAINSLASIENREKEQHKKRERWWFRKPGQNHKTEERMKVLEIWWGKGVGVEVELVGRFNRRMRPTKKWPILLCA